MAIVGGVIWGVLGGAWLCLFMWWIGYAFLQELHEGEVRLHYPWNERVWHWLPGAPIAYFAWLLYLHHPYDLPMSFSLVVVMAISAVSIWAVYTALRVVGRRFSSAH